MHRLRHSYKLHFEEIRVEAAAGQHIEISLIEAVKLSMDSGCDVILKFNGSLHRIPNKKCTEFLNSLLTENV